MRTRITAHTQCFTFVNSFKYKKPRELETIDIFSFQKGKLRPREAK